GVEAQLVREPHDQISMGWLAHTDEALCLHETPDGLSHIVMQPVDRQVVTDDALRTAAKVALGAPVGVPMLFSIYQARTSAGIEIVYRAALKKPPARPELKMVAIPELDNVAFASEFDRGIVDRFVRERRSGSFGIYAGTADAGRVEAVRSSHAPQ